MSTETKSDELELAIASAYRRPVDMQKACEEQDRLREEPRKKVGEINVSVDLIREIRE